MIADCVTLGALSPSTAEVSVGPLRGFAPDFKAAKRTLCRAPNMLEVVFDLKVLNHVCDASSKALQLGQGIVLGHLESSVRR